MIDSATAFLPDSMTTFMNFERSTEPNFGSGRISRFGTSRRRGIGVFLPSFQLARTLFESAPRRVKRPFTYSAGLFSGSGLLREHAPDGGSQRKLRPAAVRPS